MNEHHIILCWEQSQSSRIWGVKGFVDFGILLKKQSIPREQVALGSTLGTGPPPLPPLSSSAEPSLQQ